MASHKPVSDGPSRYDELIAALLRPQDVRGLTLKGLHLIMAMRVCAMFEASGRDPVPDLAQRYRSVEAACAVHGLVQTIKQVWPEPFMVNRPCCLAMTPDEATLANLGRAALAAHRDLFSMAIAGFVRADRHEALYNATIHAVALIP
jgi:hypothetical protein